MKEKKQLLLLILQTRLADALNISLDYLVGKKDIELEKNLVEKIITIQKLPQEDKYCLMYSIDGLIQHAINKQVYAHK